MWWVASLFILITANVAMIGPMRADIERGTVSTPSLTTGGLANNTTTAGGFNQSATVSIPGVGSVDFGNPLTLATAISVVVIGISVVALAGGFLTSGTSANTGAMGGYVGIILGFTALGLTIVYPVFEVLPVVGVPLFGIYAVVGLLFITYTSLGFLAGGSAV